MECYDIKLGQIVTTRFRPERALRRISSSRALHPPRNLDSLASLNFFASWGYKLVLVAMPSPVSAPERAPIFVFFLFARVAFAFSPADRLVHRALLPHRRGLSACVFRLYAFTHPLGALSSLHSSPLDRRHAHAGFIIWLEHSSTSRTLKRGLL